MNKFESGKAYTVNGGGIIIVQKRTPQYITFRGDFTGRKKVYPVNLFGLGENIVIDMENNLRLFCFAGHEISEADRIAGNYEPRRHFVKGAQA